MRASAPHQISLHFTEGVEPLFSSVEIHDAQGHVVAVSKPHSALGDDRRLLVDVPDLQVGHYKVTCGHIPCRYHNSIYAALTIERSIWMTCVAKTCGLSLRLATSNPRPARIAMR